MNSTFRYAILSAVLAAGPAMAGDFQALGSLSPAALDETRLASIEGGTVVCSSSFSVSQIICQTQLASITQANVVVSGSYNSQSNSASIQQSQAAENEVE